DRVVVETLLDVVDQAEREAGRTVTFSEGDETVEKPLGETVRAWLRRLPQQVEFAEIAGGAPGGEDTGDVRAHADRIAAYVEEQAGRGRTISYAQALEETRKSHA